MHRPDNQARAADQGMPRRAVLARGLAAGIAAASLGPERRSIATTAVTGANVSEALATILEALIAERVATGFVFTEGPLWHPDGWWYFVDLRRSLLLRWSSGHEAAAVREDTGEGNGLTCDRQGRLLMCEGGHRRVTRMEPGGTLTTLADRWQGKRLNRPNDVVCRADGSVYFTDPGLRVPPEERELESSPVFRVAPDDTLMLATTDCEYPNGLAFSPDEQILYVANSRPRKYIRAFNVQPEGTLTNSRVFAEMESTEEGVPDGMKVDTQGRIFCTGPGGRCACRNSCRNSRPIAPLGALTTGHSC